jgi:hypothetical protein
MRLHLSNLAFTSPGITGGFMPKVLSLGSETKEFRFGVVLLGLQFNVLVDSATEIGVEWKRGKKIVKWEHILSANRNDRKNPSFFDWGKNPQLLISKLAYDSNKKIDQFGPKSSTIKLLQKTKSGSDKVIGTVALDLAECIDATFSLPEFKREFKRTVHNCVDPKAVLSFNVFSKPLEPELSSLFTNRRLSESSENTFRTSIHGSINISQSKSRADTDGNSFVEQREDKGKLQDTPQKDRERERPPLPPKPKLAGSANPSDDTAEQYAAVIQKQKLTIKYLQQQLVAAKSAQGGITSNSRSWRNFGEDKTVTEEINLPIAELKANERVEALEKDVATARETTHSLIEKIQTLETKLRQLRDTEDQVSLSLSLSLSLYLSIYLSISLSIYLSISAVCLSVCLSVFLSSFLSTYRFIHLFFVVLQKNYVRTH